VTRQLSESLVIGDESHRIAAVQVAMPPRGDEFLALARRYVERLALQDAEIVVFPSTPVRFHAAYDTAGVLAGIEELSRSTKTCIAFTLPEHVGDVRYHTIYLGGPRGLLAKHRLTHHGMDTYDTGTTLGDDVCAVFTTPVGKVGLLLGAEGFVPEVARSLMLRGAELLLWSAGHPPLPMHIFARTRAEENRVYVACAGGPTANGTATIADPTGRVLGAALEGRELAVSAGINRALTRWKEVAPGTDVVRDRQPEAYGALTRSWAPESAAIAGA
jgi:predicted amidohydrolase